MGSRHSSEDLMDLLIPISNDRTEVRVRCAKLGSQIHFLPILLVNESDSMF